MDSRKSGRASFLLLSVLALVIVYGVAWLLPPGGPGTDFVAFYVAGRIARTKGYAAVYDLEVQRREQAKIVPGSDVLLAYNHPPLLLPLLALISVEDIRQAYLLWCAALLAAVTFAGVFIYKLLVTAGWDRESAVVSAASCALFTPVLVSLAQGQDTAFALLGVTAWAYYLLRREDLKAGAWLALCAVKPHVMLPLALPLLFSRPRAFWSFCGVSACVGLLSLVLLGPGGLLQFFALLEQTARGENYGLNQDRMHNFLGLELRLGVPYAHVIAWALYVGACALLCLLWRKDQGRVTIWHVGVSGLLATFFAPHLHFHDLTFLLPPLVAAAILLTRAGSPPINARALIALASVGLFLGLLTPFFWAATLALAAALGLQMYRAAPWRTA